MKVIDYPFICKKSQKHHVILSVLTLKLSLSHVENSFLIKNIIQTRGTDDR